MISNLVILVDIDLIKFVLKMIGLLWLKSILTNVHYDWKYN
jgi:hypothetical protein